MTNRVLGASLPAALLSVRLVAALSPPSPRVVVATLRFMFWSKNAPPTILSVFVITREMPPASASENILGKENSNPFEL